MIILKNINEYHIKILKGYFRRRIKRKVDWNSKKSIVIGMFYTCFQVFERIYTKIKLHNFNVLIFYLITNVFSLFVILIILPFLYFYNFEKEEEIITVVKSSNEKVYKKQLDYYHVSHLKTSDKGSINIIIDEITNYKLNFIGLTSLSIKNAGGKSQVSEAYSISHISTIYSLSDVIYEKQITYWCTFKMIDYILFSENKKIGVSVVRAFSKHEEFTSERAFILLKRKISSLLIARRVVSEMFDFDTAILHIICENNEIRNKICNELDNIKLSSVFNFIDTQLIIWISVSDIKPIFTNKLIV